MIQIRRSVLGRSMTMVSVVGQGFSLRHSWKSTSTCVPGRVRRQLFERPLGGTERANQAIGRAEEIEVDGIADGRSGRSAWAIRL